MSFVVQHRKYGTRTKEEDMVSRVVMATYFILLEKSSG